MKPGCLSANDRCPDFQYHRGQFSQYPGTGSSIVSIRTGDRRSSHRLSAMRFCRGRSAAPTRSRLSCDSRNTPSSTGGTRSGLKWSKDPVYRSSDCNCSPEALPRALETRGYDRAGPESSETRPLGCHKLDLIGIWPKYDAPDPSIGQSTPETLANKAVLARASDDGLPGLLYYGTRQFVDGYWIYLTRTSTVLSGITCSIWCRAYHRRR